MNADNWYQRNKHLLKTKERIKAWRLKTRYGITSEEYENMLVKQNLCCKICKRQTELHVDHCHKTNKVRGLLCFRCNNGLGSFNDDADRLEAAANYIRSG